MFVDIFVYNKKPQHVNIDKLVMAKVLNSSHERQLDFRVGMYCNNNYGGWLKVCSCGRIHLVKTALIQRLFKLRMNFYS